MKVYKSEIKTSLYITKLLGINFSNEITALIDKRASIAQFSRRDIIVYEGDIAAHAYLIINGIVRGYYIDADGNDITKCFSVEGEFFSSEGFRDAGESSFTIECLVDCVCVKLPYDFLHEIIDESEQLKLLVNTIYAQEVGRLERRSQSLLIKDAETRYKEFIKEYPNIFDRVSLKHIASYIGIRAASLSRIRKKLNCLEN